MKRWSNARDSLDGFAQSKLSYTRTALHSISNKETSPCSATAASAYLISFSTVHTTDLSRPWTRTCRLLVQTVSDFAVSSTAVVCTLATHSCLKPALIHHLPLLSYFRLDSNLTLIGAKVQQHSPTALFDKVMQPTFYARWSLIEVSHATVRGGMMAKQAWR